MTDSDTPVPVSPAGPGGKPRDLTVNALIALLVTARDRHGLGEAVVTVAGGRPLRTARAAPAANLVRLVQKPELSHRNWDGVVLRDGQVAGSISPRGDRFVARDAGGELGMADSVPAALELFDR